MKGLAESAWEAIHELLKGLGYEVVSSSHYSDGSESIRFKKHKKEGRGR